MHRAFGIGTEVGSYWSGGRFMRHSVILAVLGSNIGTVVGAGADSSAPDGWMNAAPRAESAPRFWVERWDEATGTFAYGLGLAGQRGESVDGRWVREIGRAHV